MRKTGPIGEVGCTIDGGQEAKTEILVKTILNVVVVVAVCVWVLQVVGLWGQFSTFRITR